MIEKGLFIIITMYCVSLGLIGGQYIADSYGLTLVNHEGVEIKSNLIDAINIEEINQATQTTTGLNQTETILDPIVGAATVAWELFQIMTGTYIFNVLYLLGIPTIFIVGMTVPFALLMIRGLVGYLRGI